jgi:hypothetical protein
VKNPAKLQEKLVKLLKQTPALNILPNYNHPWNDIEMREVAWMVQDFVNINDSVIEYDPLKDWLEEYKFYMADNRPR